MTLWTSANNYGQLLQCYALQQVLKSNGHEPYLIQYDVLARNSKVFSLKKWCKILLVYPVIKKIWQFKRKEQDKQYAMLLALKDQQRGFDDFRNKYISKSDKDFSDFEDLQRNPPIADCYIAGSDQIWAILLDRKEATACFLNFGDSGTIRISYAASFGRSVYPKKYLNNLSRALKRLNAVSVREDSGVDICAGVGIKATHVLDPTLLLKEENYMPLIEYPQIESPYFFTYQINISSGDQIKWNEIIKYTKSIGLKSISVMSSGYVQGREILDNTQYVYATIPQWLGYIKSSKFVITTSFHGVVFCLIFHKNFVYFPLSGSFGSGNNRVFSLLKSIGLENKIYSEDKSFQTILEQSVDWHSVDKRFNDLRRISYDYLLKKLA